MDYIHESKTNNITENDDMQFYLEKLNEFYNDKNTIN